MTRRERLILSGRLEADGFLPWIRRYAAKLDLSLSIHNADAGRIELDVEGAPDLIDMMDIGCSLGPIDVWVDGIVRHPL